MKNHYKAVIVGDSHAGKTNMRHRLTRHCFTPEIRTTISYEQVEMWIEFKDKMTRIDLWDTAGQEQYRSMTPIFYRDAYICVIVYDISNRRSFENAQYWYNELISRNPPAATLIGGNPNVILVGTQSDHEHLREVLTSEGAELAAKWSDTVLFCEQSAVTGQELSRIMLAFAVAVERIKGGAAIGSAAESPIGVTTGDSLETTHRNVETRPRRVSDAYRVNRSSSVGSGAPTSPTPTLRLGSKPVFKNAIDSNVKSDECCS